MTTNRELYLQHLPHLKRLEVLHGEFCHLRQTIPGLWLPNLATDYNRKEHGRELSYLPTVIPALERWATDVINKVETGTLTKENYPDVNSSKWLDETLPRRDFYKRHLDEKFGPL